MVQNGNKNEETMNKEPDKAAGNADGVENRSVEPDVPDLDTSASPDTALKGKLPFPVVGIGASAGGLAAVETFFQSMPPDAGVAFVLIQHLDPRRKTMTGELLKRYSAMQVFEAKDGMPLERNSIYHNPPGKDVGVFNGKLVLTEQVEGRVMRLPIDHFFRSVAEDQGENAVCVVLSGTGADGTQGLRTVKGSGGMTMVQDPEEAQYDGMPRSAIASGMADNILPVKEMARELMAYIRHPYLEREAVVAPEQFINNFQKILMVVRSATGHDFTHYKQNTIRRRIERRMAVHKLTEIADYVRYLQENAREVDALFRDLIIGVTNFFRDPEAFEILSRTVIPELLGRKESFTGIRVWVPGCATGEEAYSIAILIQEAVERLNKHLPVQIFATDIDPDAIDTARRGGYPASIAADVSPERLERFFVKVESGYMTKKGVRDMVVFAVQNLISDAPFSKLDLVSCRNLLIYMGPVLQKKVIPLFHYTLTEGGYLFLGSSETVGEFADLFAPVDTKWKIFQRKGLTPNRLIQHLPIPLLSPELSRLPEKAMPGRVDIRGLAEQVMIEEYAPPSVFVDERCEALFFHGQIERYLSPPRGEASFNVLKMAREELQYQLTTALHRVVKEGKPVTYEGIRVKDNGGHRTIDLVVKPLQGKAARERIFMIVFDEKPAGRKVPEAKKKRAESGIDERIVTLEQELRSTREYLQTTVEELEASNEELKSTNEELQSTNEELQSTNEELETSKEELQSTNEELVTVNTELQNKVEELSQANSDMGNLLVSTDIGTIFLDRNLRIKRFTPAVTGVFNLIGTDVGRPISDITSNIPGADLYSEARKVLGTLQNSELEVQTGKQRWYVIRILPYRTTEGMIDGVVITIVDVTAQKHLALSDAARMYSENIVNAVREPLIVLDRELKVVSANAAFYRTFSTLSKEVEGTRIYDVGNGQWNIPRLRELLEEVIAHNRSFDDFEVEHDFPGIGRKRMCLNARMISGRDGRPDLILLAIEDVTEKRRA